MLFPFIADETPAERICRIATHYIGCSLHEREAELAELVELAGPRGSVGWYTNCATFALGVLRAACGELFDAAQIHPLLGTPLEPEKAFNMLATVGQDLKAWRDPQHFGPPVRGAILWYELPGTNNDHAEIDLGALDLSGFTHCGGGRPGNSIAGGTGTVDLSAGRPLHRWLDPEALGIGVLEGERPTAPEVLGTVDDGGEST
jgi:hypothetical protein